MTGKQLTINQQLNFKCIYWFIYLSLCSVGGGAHCTTRAEADPLMCSLTVTLSCVFVL